MKNDAIAEEKVNYFTLSYGRAEERYDLFYYATEARTFDEFATEVDTAIKLAAELSVSQKVTLNSDFDLVESAGKILPDRGFSSIYPFNVYLESAWEETDPDRKKTRVYYDNEEKNDLKSSLYNIDYTHPAYLDSPERFLFSFDGRTEVLCDIIDNHAKLNDGIEELYDTLIKNGCRNIPFHELTVGCRHHQISPEYKECLGDELFAKVERLRKDSGRKLPGEPA